MFYVFVQLIEDETDDTGTKINCNPTGNPRCNQATWKRYNGYNDGCCSPEEKCSINEGDCNSHEDCAGSLVCTPNSCPSSKDPEIKAKFKFKVSDVIQRKQTPAFYALHKCEWKLQCDVPMETLLPQRAMNLTLGSNRKKIIADVCRPNYRPT